MLLLNEELPLRARHRADEHLAGCLRCRTRYAVLQRASLRTALFCDVEAQAQLRRPEHLRARLAAALEHVECVPEEPDRPSARKRRKKMIIPAVDPTFAIGAGLAVASILCFTLWIQHGPIGITSNALLVHAENWDSAPAEVHDGVIYQRIGIRTGNRRIYRTIYRDPRGRRKAKVQAVAGEDRVVQEKLTSSGVMWDTPLSATAYQNWHDRQRVRQDTVRRSGRTLVLTTTTPDGPIAEQSFTVRTADFHPTGRTVLFRDGDTIEIAELEYKVLPWAEVDASLFAPENPIPVPALTVMQPALVSRLPAAVSETELDEAELAVRVVLNLLHADTGEQIQIERSPQSIEVKGLLETERRKAELQQQLRLLPHVSIALLSMEELSTQPQPVSNTGRLAVVSAAAKASPLETYFLARGDSINGVSDLSRQLMDAALTVQQESSALTDLTGRFENPDKMTSLASAALAELMYSHRERLLLALHEEQAALDKAGFASAKPPARDDSNKTLAATSDRNLALCKELTLGNASTPRSAEAIVAELGQTIQAVHAAAYLTRPATSGGASQGAGK